MPKQCVSVDRWADEVVQVVLVDLENTEDRVILRVGQEGVEDGDLDHYVEEKFYDESGEEVSPKPRDSEQTNAQRLGDGGSSPTGVQSPEERLATLQKRKADGETLTQDEEALVSAEEQRIQALEKAKSLPQTDTATGSQSTPAVDKPVTEGAPASQPPPDRDGGAKDEGPAVDGSANQGGNVG